MGHAISNLSLGVGQSFLCRTEGVGHVFFINHISKCSPPAILFDQSLIVFSSIRFRWSPWLFSLINMLSSLARIANRFWWMNKGSLLIDSVQARSTMMRCLCTVSFSFGKYQHCEIRMMYFISFNYFETPEVVVISQSTVSKDSNNAASHRRLGPHVRLYFLEYHVELKIVYSLWIFLFNSYILY